MSFTTVKVPVCSGCKKLVIVPDVKFPEHLRYTLMEVNIPNLHWICSSCEEAFELFSSGQKTGKVESHSEDSAAESKTVAVDENETRNSRKDSSCLFKNSHERKISKEIKNESVDSGNNSPPVLSESSIKRNKTANTMVNEILKAEVTIDDIQSAKSKQIVTTFINDSLIPFFKTDEMFAEVFQRIYYTGSSYNDLKISEATEYDVNIVLSLSKQICLMPEFYERTSVFAKLNWKAIGDPSSNVSKFLEKFSQSNAFDPLKIVSWLQSLVAKFIKSKPQIQDVTKVKTFQSGPARTVQLDTVHQYSICIDLVPVFQFDYSILKDNLMLKYFPVDESKQFWFLVPKPCRGEQLMFAHEVNLSWRVDLPEAERAVLYNKQCAKPVIKLLKLLRDKQNWSSYLSSYHCKTVVLWELKKNGDSQYWCEKFLYERMLETLKSLISFYKEKRLPYFFDEDYNLFYQMSSIQASNMYSRLTRIVKDIEGDSENLKKHFKFNADATPLLKSIEAISLN